MSISNNLIILRKLLPKEVTIVAVSKTKPISDILEAYKNGQHIFGENKVQEMLGKFDALPKDIKWHMIGHLQRNKIKYMAHFVNLIHGVTSLETLKEINKQAVKHQRTINCLLQIKIATEDTKFGLTIKDTESILNNEILNKYQNIKIVGFMGMASFTTNKSQIKKEFQQLKSAFNTLKNKYYTENINLTILSMGMSNDYKIAIKNGSNMVRIGSVIFSKRDYVK